MKIHKITFPSHCRDAWPRRSAPIGDAGNTPKRRVDLLGIASSTDCGERVLRVLVPCPDAQTLLHMVMHTRWKTTLMSVQHLVVADFSGPKM